MPSEDAGNDCLRDDASGAAGDDGDVDGRKTEDARASARPSDARSAWLRCSVCAGSRTNVGDTGKPLALRIATAGDCDQDVDANGMRGGDANCARGGVDRATTWKTSKDAHADTSAETQKSEPQMRGIE